MSVALYIDINCSSGFSFTSLNNFDTSTVCFKSPYFFMSFKLSKALDLKSFIISSLSNNKSFKLLLHWEIIPPSLSTFTVFSPMYIDLCISMLKNQFRDINFECIVDAWIWGSCSCGGFSLLSITSCFWGKKNWILGFLHPLTHLGIGSCQYESPTKCLLCPVHTGLLFFHFFGSTFLWILFNQP